MEITWRSNVKNITVSVCIVIGGMVGPVISYAEPRLLFNNPNNTTITDLEFDGKLYAVSFSQDFKRSFPNSTSDFQNVRDAQNAQRALRRALESLHVNCINSKDCKPREFILIPVEFKADKNKIPSSLWIGHKNQFEHEWGSWPNPFDVSPPYRLNHVSRIYWASFRQCLTCGPAQ
jgi:hypothetical protein